jgi:DegV family protein with EDD domain
MHKVAVVTDSVADIPPQLAEELDITIVPLILRFGADVYRDSLDISPDEYYQKLATAKALPKTSAPPPLAFTGIYDRLAEKTEGILYVGLSSRLSGTFQVASQAVGLMKNKCRVELLDSQWAAMAQGFITYRRQSSYSQSWTGRSVIDSPPDYTESRIMRCFRYP